MIIRKTRIEDVTACANIYDSARAFMAQNGNPTQWKNTYPNRESVEQDIAAGIGYVCEDRGEVVAVFAFAEGNEPTYDKIYDGKWLNERPYAYIHRIAVKYHGRGIAGLCIDYCYSKCKNLKIDTHRNNIPMQRMLEKSGFSRCGIIYLENGEERIAYQKE